MNGVPAAFKLKMAPGSDSRLYGTIYINSVELYRPYSDEFPELQGQDGQGHKFTVGQQLSYDLTLNPIRQVYVSDDDIPLNQIERHARATILGKYHRTCLLGTICVINAELSNTDGFLMGKWVTIVDESKQPIILSEIRVFGFKRDPGVPVTLPQAPGIPSLSFP